MIIDFHTHIFPALFRDKRDLFFQGEPDFELLYRSPESRMSGKNELLGNMDKDGVNRSIVFGFPWKDSDNFKRHNDYIIESVLEHPDRLMGFCCFDAMSPEAPKEAERCLEAGLMGIGELAIYDSDFSPDVIKALKDIMDISLQYDVPVLLHTNEPVGHQYPGKQPMGLGALYELLKRYPENKMVLAHWGGGIFFYMMMKKEVRGTFRNVWFDTAASPYLYKPDIYRIAGEIMGFDKILFGSDYPLIRPERYFKELESANLSLASIQKIKGENAARLLRLR